MSDGYDEFLKMLATTPSKDTKNVEEPSAVIESKNAKPDPELEQVPSRDDDVNDDDCDAAKDSPIVDDGILNDAAKEQNESTSIENSENAEPTAVTTDEVITSEEQEEVSRVEPEYTQKSDDPETEQQREVDAQPNEDDEEPPLEEEAGEYVQVEKPEEVETVELKDETILEVKSDDAEENDEPVFLQPVDNTQENDTSNGENNNDEKVEQVQDMDSNNHDTTNEKLSTKKTTVISTKAKNEESTLFSDIIVFIIKIAILLTKTFFQLSWKVLSTLLTWLLTVLHEQGILQTTEDESSTPIIQDPNKVIPDYIIDICAQHPHRIFLTQPYPNGKVKNWTFDDFISESKKMAGYIESLALPIPSQIAIMSKNCAYWLMADMAVMMTGHVGVPIYPTLTAETTKYTLEHSEAKLLFVGKLDDHPWNEMKAGIPQGMKCVSFPMCPEGLSYDKWDDCLKDEVKEIKKRTGEELATIIYTSGSTGVPKGVMLSFKNMTDPTFGLIKQIHATSKDRYLSYLPCSHGMERWVGECIPFVTGEHVFFADTLSTFVQDLNRCRPTLFLSVPRLWTKFQQGVFKKMEPEKLDKLLKIPVVSWLVKRKLLKALGLQDVRYAGSGSAPLPSELLAWYRNLGLELLEGYGMTENFNYSHLTRVGRGRVGYVGEPNDGVKQMIADDGELLIQSPGLMMGYFKNEEATKEAITVGGWLRTGDKGELDPIGRLKITGRTKEIFKTSKGKYVAPAPIENQYIAHQRVELACVGGRGQPAAHVIVLLNDDSFKMINEDEKMGVIEKEMEDLLRKVNAGLDEHEKIQFIAVVNEEWLPENGFVTPTNKIKRSKIEEEHASFLDEWYGSKKKVIWHKWL